MTPRNRLLTIALAIFFVIGAGAAFMAIKNSTNPFANLRNKNACDILTPKKAEQLLNDSVRKDSDMSITAPIETPTIKRTRCAYLTQNKSPQNISMLSLELRAAKAAAGSVENASHFSPNINSSTKVPDYGDEASWDAASGQLSILKDGNLYLLKMTKDGGAHAGRLTDLQKVADVIGLKN